MAAPAPGAPTADPIIAPPPAPATPPMMVPFSRVERGSPEHPAIEASMAPAMTNAPIFLLVIGLLTPSHGVSIMYAKGLLSMFDVQVLWERGFLKTMATHYQLGATCDRERIARLKRRASRKIKNAWH